MPGKQYRITDYVTTTTQMYTSSAGHQFDIIVVADDVNVLNENARAALHDGDAYFKDCDLNTWKLWYCLDNDADRFVWADTTNGKGVIYRMIDEFENDLPYDFKNIMFHRYLMVDMQKSISEEWAVKRQRAGLPVAWIGMSEDNFSKKKLDDLGATYTYYNNWGEKDFFTFWVSGDDECSVKGVIKNVNILPTYDVDGKKQQLNNNIFILSDNTLKVENVKLGYYNYNNTLRAVSNVEFGNSCAENIVADVSNIKMGNRCYLNIIQGSNISMGNFCSYNTFGTHNYKNSGCLNCLDKCSYNTFLYGEIVTLGVGCEKNSHSSDELVSGFYTFLTFGDYCKRNSGYIYDKSVFNDYVTDVHLESSAYALTFMPGTYGTIYANKIPKDNTKNIVISENGKIKFVNFDTCETKSITYLDLVNLRNNGKLIPGQQYRIIDYITTTIQENTQSARHQFDIIVLALTENELCEEAYAAIHEGDTYFTNSNLSVWKLWYCLDNDTTRFAWADTTDGTGVIYRMIDEFGNECPYDFKNIQFARWELSNPVGYKNDYDDKNWRDNWVSDSRYNSLKQGLYGLNGSTKNFYYGVNENVGYNYYKVEYTISSSPTYCYTFGKDSDYSLTGSNYSNVIKEYKYNAKIRLNNIVFLSNSCYNNTFGTGCYNNTFGTGCYNNTFGTGCYNNTFGDFYRDNTFGNSCYGNTFGAACISNTFGYNCGSNTFGTNCYHNTFGTGCYNNTFGDFCDGNIFGNSCHNNIFGSECNYNTFGNDCESNTFGDYCSYNTFIGSCKANTFGDYCSYNTFIGSCKANTFGDYCSYNTFGNSSNYNTFGSECNYNTFGNSSNYNTFGTNCYNNTFGTNCCNNTFGASNSSPKSYYRYIIFDNGNSYINLNCTSTTSGSNYFQNVRIGLGVNNTTTYKTIDVSTVNSNYEIKVANNSNGELKIYCEADLIA